MGCSRRQDQARSVIGSALDTLQKLAQMGDNDLHALWGAIETATVGMSGRQLEEHIAANSTISPRDAHNIAAVLSHIYVTKVRRDEWVADEFMKAIASAFFEKRQLDEHATSRFREILSKLLSFDRLLGLTARATDLLSEYERTIDDVRILTDIRPVFDSGTDVALAATLIVHNMRIRYVDNSGQVKEFIVAMDSNDLKELEKATERAAKKEAELRAFMTRSGMHCIAVATE